MVAKPVTASLTKELRVIQQRWLTAGREERDIIYANEFAPRFVPLFRQLPLDGWTGERPRFKAVISVLGLSWQPVALMTAWAEPEHVLILGTSESVNAKIGTVSVLEIIAGIAGIPKNRITIQEIKDPVELAIYRGVRDFAERYELKPHEMAIDPTGGKKSMSASAALAGFLLGARIVYVDSSKYHPQDRIPIAGTEYPRVLHNPLDVFGDLEFDRIKQAYRNGNYNQALHMAESLSERLYEPREAEALTLLNRGYGAWDRFDFEKAVQTLRKLKENLNRFLPLGGWKWGSSVVSHLEKQLPIIEDLASITTRVCNGEKPKNMEEGLPLVLNHLAAAKRALSRREIGTSILLVYATLERYVDLCLWVYHGLDDEKPDYSGLDLDLEAFHRIGRILHKGYQKREPGGPVTLSLGVQLMATTKPELLPQKFLGPIRGIMNDRNKCEYEHGLCPKTFSQEIVEKHLQTVKGIINTFLKGRGKDIEKELEKYAFPQI